MDTNDTMKNNKKFLHKPNKKNTDIRYFSAVSVDL
jgi:hypothetical protein